MSRLNLRLDLQNLAWLMINRPVTTVSSAAEFMTIIGVAKKMIASVEDTTGRQADHELQTLTQDINSRLHHLGKIGFSGADSLELVVEVGRLLDELAERLR